MWCAGTLFVIMLITQCNSVERQWMIIFPSYKMPGALHRTPTLHEAWRDFFLIVVGRFGYQISGFMVRETFFLVKATMRRIIKALTLVTPSGGIGSETNLHLVHWVKWPNARLMPYYSTENICGQNHLKHSYRSFEKKYISYKILDKERCKAWCFAPA